MIVVHKSNVTKQGCCNVGKRVEQWVLTFAFLPCRMLCHFWLPSATKTSGLSLGHCLLQAFLAAGKPLQAKAETQGLVWYDQFSGAYLGPDTPKLKDW